MRDELPDRRKCITQSMRVGNQTVHFTVGLYPDGRPGELFIDMHRTGTAVRAWCESTAKLISLMLQYRVPLQELVEVLAGHCTESFGRVPVSGHPVIIDTSGVLDAVIRAIALDFLASDKEQPSLISALKESEHMGAAEIYEAVEDAGETEAFDNFIGKFI